MAIQLNRTCKKLLIQHIQRNGKETKLGNVCNVTRDNIKLIIILIKKTKNNHLELTFMLRQPRLWQTTTVGVGELFARGGWCSVGWVTYRQPLPILVNLKMLSPVTCSFTLNKSPHFVACRKVMSLSAKIGNAATSLFFTSIAVSSIEKSQQFICFSSLNFFLSFGTTYTLSDSSITVIGFVSFL